MYIELTSLSLFLGVLLDFILGDPKWLWHPVVGIGKLISFIEKKYRDKHPEDTPEGKRKAGTFMWILVVLITGIVSGVILYVGYKLGKTAYVVICTIMCYQIMATKSLKDESMKVYKSLEKGDLEEARMNVSMIVGRDTSVLDETGVAKAAIETIAENASDGCVAPLFYMMIGGPVLGFIYKAVNTMDSMVGYKNEKYIDYGRTAAKMDDIFNYIPARLAAINMIIASMLIWLDGTEAIIIFKRDRKKSTSPNSGQTESVCAGALNIELLGDAVYFGETVHKETVGDPNKPVENKDIKRANKLLYATVIVSFGLFMGVRALAIAFFTGLKYGWKL